MEVQESKPNVILYVTPGCESCNVMSRIINATINHISDNIVIKSSDIIFRTVSIINPKDFIIDDIEIHDFPTIHFIKNNYIVDTIVGIVPERVIIDNLLKLI